MAHFWDGQGEHGRASGKRKGSRRRGGETLRCTNPCQEGKSHQHQRDVSVPTDEATNFVMVQPQVFGVFKILFDVPACANGRNHLWQGRSFWSKDEVVCFLVGIGEATADEHPMASIVLPLVQDGNIRPDEEPGAFASLTHGEALPILGVKQERFHFPDFYSSALSITGQYANRFIARDGQYIRVLMGFQPGTQVQIAAIDRVCHHPSNWYLGIPHTRQHASRQFRFRLEADRLWDTSRLTPLTVLCPVQG